jgi:16S rRNA (cytosine1402-N4)-methyltransferase
VSGVNLDLGVSSDQLSSERGFSFRLGQPLDMRFNPEGGDLSAAEVIANIDQKELAKQLWELAEVPAAERLAKRMKEASRQGLMETTDDLVAVCNEVLGPRIRKISSATLPFQALRIMTNRELERLDSFLESAPGLLAKGGRIAILSFHSVEDRMVKFAFRRLAETGDFKMPFRKAMKPSREEILSNRRSRSAKLRVLERCN